MTFFVVDAWSLPIWSLLMFLALPSVELSAVILLLGKTSGTNKHHLLQTRWPCILKASWSPCFRQLVQTGVDRWIIFGGFSFWNCESSVNTFSYAITYGTIIQEAWKGVIILLCVRLYSRCDELISCPYT